MAYKILLVEDEDTMRRLMSLLLKRGGHQVIEAADGETAIDLAVRQAPDLILLDIMMPVIDGFETLRRLRALPDTEDIPVIFLSAKSQVEDRVEGLRLGADDYIVKPADPEELMARIEAVMARSLREVRRRKGKIFGFIGAKGGVGTTTTVVNMGVHFQQEYQDALLIDLHLAFGNLADQLGLAPVPHSTADLALMPPEEIDEDAIDRNRIAHESGIHVLASPPTVPTGITFSAEHLTAMVEQAAYTAPFILIDLPIDPDIVEVVSEQLDGIIMVLGGEPASLRSAENLAVHLGRLGLHNRLGALLVNRTGAEQQYVTGNLVTEKLGCLFLGSIPYKPERYLRAEYTRVPLLLESQDSSEHVIYADLGEKLLNYLEITEQFRKRQRLESKHLA